MASSPYTPWSHSMAGLSSSSSSSSVAKAEVEDSPMISVVGASFTFGSPRPAPAEPAVVSTQSEGSSASSETCAPERFSHNPYSYEELAPAATAEVPPRSRAPSTLDVPAAPAIVPGSSLRQRRANRRNSSLSSVASSLGCSTTPAAAGQLCAVAPPELNLESSVVTPIALPAVPSTVGLPEVAPLGASLGSQPSLPPAEHPPSPTSSTAVGGGLGSSQRSRSGSGLQRKLSFSLGSESRSGNRSPANHTLSRSGSGILRKFSVASSSAMSETRSGARSPSLPSGPQSAAQPLRVEAEQPAPARSISPTSEMKQLQEVQELLLRTLTILQAHKGEQAQSLPQQTAEAQTSRQRTPTARSPKNQDPKQSVCRDFLKGTCSLKRWKCKFLHTPLHPSLSPEAEVPLPITEPVATRGTSPLLPARPVCASCPTCEENRRRGLVAEGQPPFMAPVTSPVMTSVMPQPWFHLAGIPTTPSVPPLPTTPPVCGPCLGYTGAMPWEYLTPEGLLVHGMQPCSHCVGPYPAALPH